MSRTLMVTGATGGAAPDVARRLLDRGDRLLLVGRSAEALAAIEAELGGGDRVATFAGQVSDPAQADAAVAHGVERLGPLQGLINLAGSFRAGLPVAIAEPADYMALIEANLMVGAMASRAVLRQLSGEGWFVFVTAFLAREPMPTMGPLAASKAALEGWAKAFHLEVKDRGVHVNVLDVTLLDTPTARASRPGMDPSLCVSGEHFAQTIEFLTSDGGGAFYGGLVPLHGKFSIAGGPPPGAAGGPPPGAGGPGAGGPGGGPPPGAGGPPPAERKRYALFYPFKPGKAAESEPLFQAGGDPPQQAGATTRLLSTTVFRFGDTVVRTFEIEGDLEEAVEHMVIGSALSDLGVRLKPLMDESVDLTTPDGLRHFFTNNLMEIVTDRTVA
jgi:NAD(P)-dependent dehydrogenase (short-subunit alcohol dehydrogenase family)